MFNLDCDKLRFGIRFLMMMLLGIFLIDLMFLIYVIFRRWGVFSFNCLVSFFNCLSVVLLNVLFILMRIKIKLLFLKVFLNWLSWIFVLLFDWKKVLFELLIWRLGSWFKVKIVSVVIKSKLIYCNWMSRFIVFVVKLFVWLFCVMWIFFLYE